MSNDLPPICEDAAVWAAWLAANHAAIPDALRASVSMS